MSRSSHSQQRSAYRSAKIHVAVAAYEQWLDDEDAELGLLLDAAMRQLGAAFTTP